MIQANMKQIFHCDVTLLWNIITDNTRYAWRSDLSKLEIIDETHFIEYAKNQFPTYFTITSKKPFTEYRFSLENKNIQGSWIGIFKEQKDGSVLLDFTEAIKTERFIMKLLAKPYIKRQQKRYMKDLMTEVEKRQSKS